jgi:hypothetical protein
MFDRHWLGDLALAVLLAIPTAALASTAHSARVTGTSSAQSHNERSPVENRFSLFAPN